MNLEYLIQICGSKSGPDFVQVSSAVEQINGSAAVPSGETGGDRPEDDGAETTSSPGRLGEPGRQTLSRLLTQQRLSPTLAQHFRHHAVHTADIIGLLSVAMPCDTIQDIYR